MSTIQAIAFRRNQLGNVWKTFSEITRPGVYILLGQDEGNVDKWTPLETGAAQRFVILSLVVTC